MSQNTSAADGRRKDREDKEFGRELNVSVLKINMAAGTLRCITEYTESRLMDAQEKERIVSALWGVIEHLETASAKLSPYV